MADRHIEEVAAGECMDVWLQWSVKVIQIRLR